MKGITKEVIEQDYNAIKEMLSKYSDAIYENQESQLVHFDDKSSYEILIYNIRHSLNIVKGAFNVLKDIIKD